MRFPYLALAIFWTASVLAQSSDVAKIVYTNSEGAVFLVYVNDSSGTPTALGSAFLVAPRELITNAHVVEVGSPVLAVGPVRIPLKVLRINHEKDLALLSVDADLISQPLKLSTGLVSPGETIYAIGNPEGLEKTISTGIVSGLRLREGRQLLQITSPISHGSSGGPILNSNGEVVGVAVGMLEDGQNLNFAVPVADVRAIIAGDVDHNTNSTDATNAISAVRSLIEKQEKAQYSDDPNSEYQQDRSSLLSAMESAVSASTKPEQLRQLTCIGVQKIDLSDDGIRAARKLLQSTSSPDDRALLAYALYDRALNGGIAVEFATKGSQQEDEAKKALSEYQSDADREAEGAIRGGRGNSLLILDYVIGSLDEGHGNYAAAVPLHTAVANGHVEVCGVDLTKNSYASLVTEMTNLNNPRESENWFRKYASIYEPAAYEWDSEGDRRAHVSDYKAAAVAYETAANQSSSFAYDFCYAAEQRFDENPTDEDNTLADGRACIDASVKNTDKNKEANFNSVVPPVYRYMAAILDSRGVYQQALEYIKESLSGNPAIPQGYSVEADIFHDLQRNTECIAAEQQAIRLSDGKYPYMQFRLGTCYFASEDWVQAASSFRLAAESDPTDATSAFNLGISLQRQGFNSDANIWFRKALERKPDEELKQKILDALK